MKDSKEYTCCFLGHRAITKTDELIEKLYSEIERLIIKENVHTFLFGSKSQFDDLCYNVVSKLKVKYPQIKRVYVRSAYADVDNDYIKYLLEYYEDTYYPEKTREARKASYVERNQDMIDSSKFCIFYYDENYLPPKRKDGYQPKSGTSVAYDFATKKRKKIINVYR